MKNFSLRAGAVLLQIGLPFSPLLIKGDFIVFKDPQTVLSGFSLLILIISSPILTKTLQGKNMTPTVTKLWVAVFVVCLILEPLIFQLKVIAGLGIGGNVAAKLLYSQADKLKEAKSKEEQAKLIADNLRSEL